MNPKGTLVLFFLLAQSWPGISQFKNIMLDEYAGERGSGCQLTIAVNPRYPTNIVAGSTPDNFYYTKDAGKTWHKGKVTSPFGAFGNPAIISDEKGNFF